jgi:anti-sigma B factor antagonist
MEFNVKKDNDVSIVSFTVASLDANNSREFKESIASVLGQNKKLVFDMGKLEFVDSSGLGAILSCLRKMNSDGGDLKLCGISKTVRTLFELVRMHKVFEIFNTQDETINSYRS